MERDDKFKGIFDDAYAFQDGPGCPVHVGFEFDPKHGHITMITEEAAARLFSHLAKIFPWGQTGTEQAACAVTFSHD